MIGLLYLPIQSYPILIVIGCKETKKSFRRNQKKNIQKQQINLRIGQIIGNLDPYFMVYEIIPTQFLGYTPEV